MAKFAGLMHYHHISLYVLWSSFGQLYTVFQKTSNLFVFAITLLVSVVPEPSPSLRLTCQRLWSSGCGLRRSTSVICLCLCLPEAIYCECIVYYCVCFMFFCACGWRVIY